MALELFLAAPNGRNWLLQNLPEAETAWLNRVLRPVRYQPRDVLFRSGERINAVYFPGVGRVGLFSELSDGSLCSVGGAGCRAIVGASVIGGADISIHTALTLTPTSGHAMRADFLPKALEQTTVFANRVLRYQHVLMTVVAQVAFCNRHHEVQQQLSRWLLTEMNSSLSGTPIVVTQALISEILGVRRESVTLAARKLQALGGIEYRRSSIQVVDAAILEACACDCYQIIRTQYDALLPVEPVSAAAQL